MKLTWLWGDDPPVAHTLFGPASVICQLHQGQPAIQPRGFATLLTKNWTKIRETSFDYYYNIFMKRNSICALFICLLAVIFALWWCYRINQIILSMIIVYLAILFDPCRSLCDKLKCDQRSAHWLHDAQHHAYIITHRASLFSCPCPSPPWCLIFYLLPGFFFVVALLPNSVK